MKKYKQTNTYRLFLQVEDTDWVTDYEAHINSHQVCFQTRFSQFIRFYQPSFSLASMSGMRCQTFLLDDQCRLMSCP